MFAAVVTAFDQLPRYQEFPTPQPQSETEVLVDVITAGLHPRVRSQADGSHYTSTDELPLIPGIDGVGRTQDGELRYFILPDATLGSMAEHTVIDVRRSVVLPAACNPILVAAAMNPAMASWVALRQRIDFRPGQSVLVLGATGSAGQLAVQIAKFLGAGQVVAAGRGAERLAELPGLGADVVVSLEGDPEDVAARLGRWTADVDVVLDFLWGQPTAHAIVAVVMNRTDQGRPLTWIEIGSVAGAVASIPSAALRAARLQIVGSGQGSVETGEILAELPELAAQISRGIFQINATAVPLRDVEAAWRDGPKGTERVVVIPSSSVEPT